jgi:hypothetical protein
MRLGRAAQFRPDPLAKSGKALHHLTIDDLVI